MFRINHPQGEAQVVPDPGITKPGGYWTQIRFTPAKIVI